MDDYVRGFRMKDRGCGNWGKRIVFFLDFFFVVSRACFEWNCRG